jgi:Ion channel
MLVIQPLLAHDGMVTDEAVNAAFALVYFYVVFIVFRKGWERRAALVLFFPVVASVLAVRFLSADVQTALVVALHCTIIVFLGFAVTAVLGGLFRSRVVRGDDVLGAVCGYILSALAWSHVYALTYMLRPGAFSVSPTIAAQLEEPHLRRTLFDYLSLTTLTSIGYGDIIPAGPPMYSLTWLETMFGQFYMAVVVAQLVGLKLAQAVRPDPT